jgi:hypothetical protein
MLIEPDLGQICRDERCDIEEIHAKHQIRCKREEDCGPKYRRPWSQPDRAGLAECVLRATSDRVPRWFQEITPEIRDDYGNVSDRTVMRVIRDLVKHGRLIKLELGLAFAAYMKPATRPVPGRLATFDEQRDYMLGITHPTGTF